MKRTRLFLSITGFIMITVSFQLVAYSPAELFTGNVYLAGSNPPELLFTHENSYEKNGNTEILTHTYRTPDGKIATVEKVTETGRKVDLYEVEFMNSECGCRLDRNGESMTFSFTRGNTDKKGVKPYESSLVTGPRLNTLAVENWDPIVSGKKVYFYLAAMPLQQVVKFQLVRKTDTPYNRTGVEVMRMDLSNGFLRLFIQPVDLVLDVQTKRLLEIHGKSLLERVVDGKTENPNVDIYYTYKDLQK